MHDELRSTSRPDPHILCNLLLIWLRQVERALRPATENAPSELLAVRAAIENRFSEPLQLADLAQVAGCSRQHLCSAFRRWFATTPVEHLVRMRLQHARLLLEDHHLGVAEVATAVGFRDYRHFARLFKRRFGHPARGG